MATSASFRFPVLYLPYATFPAEKQRASGFLIPDSRRQFQQRLYLWRRRLLGAHGLGGLHPGRKLLQPPWLGAEGRLTHAPVGKCGAGHDLLGSGGSRSSATHRPSALIKAATKRGCSSLRCCPDGWRAVADLDHLSSLTYRLAWSETYVQAVNSEVRNSAFLTNNFRGFSLNFAALSYQNYVERLAVNTMYRCAPRPEVRFSSVDQAPWQKLPVLFFLRGIFRCRASLQHRHRLQHTRILSSAVRLRPPLPCLFTWARG